MSRRDAAQFLAMAVFMIGAVSLASYLFGLPHLRRWSAIGADMAANTATCLMLLGLAVLLLASEEKKG